MNWEQKLAYDTWDSQAVSDPSTNQAQRCLTWQIGRDAVCSTWYGRKRYGLNVHERNIFIFLKISGAERRSKIAMTPIFQGSHRRVIGISFQPAINAPRLGLIGHVIASAQKWSVEKLCGVVYNDGGLPAS